MLTRLQSKVQKQYAYWTTLFECDEEAKWITTHQRWKKQMMFIIEDEEKRGVVTVVTRDCVKAWYKDPSLGNMGLGPDDVGRYHVYYIYVRPQFRHQGVATRLIRKAIDRFGSVTVEAINGAEEFWDKQGFVEYEGGQRKCLVNKFKHSLRH